MRPLFFGIVKNGKLTFNEPARLTICLAGLEGKDVQVSIEQKRKHRSLSQNNYYWGVVIEILSEHFGYFKEEMHDALRMKFLVITKEADNLNTLKSTAKLSTVDMEKYLENVRIWAMSEYQILIPEPNETIEWGDDNDN